MSPDFTMKIILAYVNFLYPLSKDVMDFWKIVCFRSVFSGQTSWSFPGRSPALFRGIQCHPGSESTRYRLQEIHPVQVQGFKWKNHTAVQNSMSKNFFSHLIKEFLIFQGKIKKLHPGSSHQHRRNSFHLTLLFPVLVFLHLHFRNN